MITTHVLDTAAGRPAEGVPVELDLRDSGGAWKRLGQGATDADGRLRTLTPEKTPLQPGTYALRFDTAAYFAKRGLAGFYPEVRVTFEIRDAGAHYHVPLLLSPFGYSTYRGS